MQEGRTYTIRKKPKLILNKSFSVFKELNVEDKGLLSLVGIIKEKKIRTQPDGTELTVQSLDIISAEKVEILGVKRV